jgi:hypothetical protein
LLLPLAQYCYNDTKHSSTNVSPFYANYGVHPGFNTDVRIVDSKTDIRAVHEVDHLNALHQVLRQELTIAQERMKRNYDAHTDPAPDLQVGQKVWLSARNIITKRRSKKLDYKQLGPYTILEKYGSSAFRLDLPSQMEIHPTFHVSLLHPYKENNIPDRIPAPPPIVIVNDLPHEEIDAILDSRTYKGALQYFVSWKNQPNNEWVDSEDINAPMLIAEFRRLYPNKVSAPATRRSSRNS